MVGFCWAGPIMFEGRVGHACLGGAMGGTARGEVGGGIVGNGRGLQTGGGRVLKRGRSRGRDGIQEGVVLGELRRK